MKLAKELVITTKEWGALVECLKGNLKFGYSKLKSLKQADGYFTAVLCQETDASYLERLKIVTGHSETGEEDETGTLLYFLSLQPLPITLQLTPEVVEPVQTTCVVTKIKRTPRGKK